MSHDQILALGIAVGNTLTIYMPAWVLGTALGIMISSAMWSMPQSISKNLYALLAGISFIPTTILIPYFLRTFGLAFFIYPLLVLPVTLITVSSSFEAFEHANRHRATILVNYGISKANFFWKVVFRESLPSMKTTTRQTVSLCFAMFLAIDYFMENWGGLGKLAQLYYSRPSDGMNDSNQALLLVTIATAGVLGLAQVVLNDMIFRRVNEFRKHY
jgi:ABC-type nitrate/sulfonate/bicarbonate transport system permease component